MNGRRSVLVILAASPSMVAGAAQASPKLFGVLDPFPEGSNQTEASIRKQLRDFGYVEAPTLKIAVVGSKGRDELLPKMAGQLVTMRPAVILTYGDVAGRAALAATTQIPIVVMSDDLIGAGLVASLRVPGGNVTGVSVLAGELDAKRLELLGELLPPRSRVLVLRDGVTSPQSLPTLRSAALVLGLQLLETIVRTPQEIHDALSTARSRHVAGVNVLASPVLFAIRDTTIADVNAMRLPAVFEWGFFADEGALIGYGPLLGPLYRRLFDQAMGLLRGGRVADYPVEQATRFELVINAKTAQAIGVAIPQSLLLRADRVVR